MSEMLELMEKLKREIAEGGELKDLPCPFCQKPRSQRSDYVRCSPCGINWLQSEMGLPNYLNRNPSACRSEAARTIRGEIRSSAEQSEADVKS